MASRSIFLLSALPGLGGLGSKPPCTGADLVRLAAGSPAESAVRAVWLAEDLLLHESHLASRKTRADLDPAVLTPEQVRGEVPLPTVLAQSGSTADRSATEARWAAWAGWARTQAHGLLPCWVDAELALRNQVARVRAEALGWDPGAWIWQPDWHHPGSSERDLAGQAGAAVREISDPLVLARRIDDLRWAWLDALDPRYSNTVDEAVAYAIRLGLLQRWHLTGAAAAAA